MTSSRNKLLEKLEKLGPDFLKEDFTNEDFYMRIKKYLTTKTGKLNLSRMKKKIVQVLMEQQLCKGFGSGLGNYLIVEILYNARISPHKTIYEIFCNRLILDSLSKAIKYIVKLSFETNISGYIGHLDKDIKKFIYNLRKDIKLHDNHENNYHKKVQIKKNKFSFKVYRKKKDPHGNIVKVEKNLIKNRTTYWSPTVQK
jgi:formamidopyrimidine-DNA glycosylase